MWERFRRGRQPEREEQHIDLAPLAQVPRDAIVSTYLFDGDLGNYVVVSIGNEKTPGLLRRVLPDGSPVMGEDGATPVGRVIPHGSVVFIVGLSNKQ